MKIITEEEKTKKEKLGVREQTKDDDNEMDNMNEKT